MQILGTILTSVGIIGLWLAWKAWMKLRRELGTNEAIAKHGTGVKIWLLIWLCLTVVGLLVGIFG